MVQKFKKRSLPIELKGNNPRLKCEFVSTMDQYYFDRFGCFMIDSFLKNTPDNFVLHLYAEKINSKFTKTDKLKVYDWNHVCLKNWKDFCNKTENKKEVKFAKKGFAFLHALENIKGDYIIWVDADIFFKQKIDTAIQNFNNQFKKVTGKDPTQGLTTISNDAVKLYNAITQLAKNYNPDNTVARETETGQMKNVQKTQQANQQQAGATQQPQQQAGATQPQPANESYSKLEKTLGSEFCKILEESLKRSL